MKTGKKVMILLLIFVAAVIVYFIHPVGKKEEHGITEYTAMEKAKFPVLYATMGEREMAPVFGQTEERGVTADRGSLIVLPEDRKLKVRFAGTTKIQGLRYEIRSLDTENLIERTQVTSLDAAINGDSENAVSAELLIQNLLETGKEYLLGVCASLPDGSEAWYYMRIVEQDQGHVNEMLALAEEFSSKTYKYSDAQSLAMYMETSPSANSSALGTVTLKDTFTQLTWGSLGVERTGEAYTKLKELSGNLANVEIATHVTAKDGEKTETYEVTENFTMKWASQRIYMMDYERTMNQIFDGGSEQYSGKRIMLGISDSHGLQELRSPNGEYQAFVVNRELWMYSRADSQSTRVFSFRQSETDEMANLQDYGIKLLSAGDDGTVDFLVSGYMSRGSHEGGVGVSLWRYEKGTNTLTERLYLPANESSEELLMGMDTLSCLSSSGTLYLLMGNTVYSVDTASRQAQVLAEGMTEENFAVSPGQERIAWQDGEDLYDSRSVHIMDLETGKSAQIKAPEGSSIRLLGFVGGDLVYGLAEENSSVKVNGRTVQAPMYALEIVGKDMNLQTRYEKEGVYITDVEIEGSRVHLQRMTRVGDSYMTAGADTLVCNEEVEEDSMEGIGYLASEEQGRVYFVQTAESVSGGVDLNVPSKAVAEENNTVVLGQPEPSGRRQYYAYSGGRLRGVFESFPDAVTAAYDGMGIVTDEDGSVFWSRVDRADMITIRNPESLVPDLERYLKGFEEGDEETSDGGAIIDAGGLSLNQILYFISRGYPVAAYTGDGSYAVIYGYDAYNISCLWYPGTEQAYTDKMGLNDAASWFEANGGNGFVAFLFED